ncbi:hypothetical protein RUM44_000797 [Polyplax serrata]|uniref:Dynein regulatory complex subunit 4 n=1 Tax=Polyplax serrata TaxID=468196 RepID=A0ABR1B677_POLSC
MAPKSKKNSAGKGRSGSGDVVDGVSTTEMTREQLEQHANRLRSEIEREREERHFFQLERDKLRTFWEITRQQLQENQAELRNKDRELEEKEEHHQEQIKVFKQKLKHLLYEHQLNIADLRAENVVSLKMAQDDFNEQEFALLADKLDLKERILEQVKKHEEVLRTLKIEFSENLNVTRKELETQRTEIQSRYEKLLESQRNELLLLHKMELSEVNERKNKQISDLMKNHEKAFTDMKIYYNDITLNNLALISSLKEQIMEVKIKEERMGKSLREIHKENRKLTEPMKKVKEESMELARQLTQHTKNKHALEKAKKALVASQKEIESLKWENQVLEMKSEQLESEKNELNGRFLAAVLEVQQKASLRNMLLEKKLRTLLDLVEQREVQISEVLSECQLDPGILPSINNRVEALLSKKNAAVQDIERELAKTCKAHDNLLKSYELLLQKYNIPREELADLPDK